MPSSRLSHDFEIFGIKSLYTGRIPGQPALISVGEMSKSTCIFSSVYHLFYCRSQMEIRKAETVKVFSAESQQ